MEANWEWKPINIPNDRNVGYGALRFSFVSTKYPGVKVRVWERATEWLSGGVSIYPYRHRDGAPAVIWSGGSAEWWERGIRKRVEITELDREFIKSRDHVDVQVKQLTDLFSRFLPVGSPSVAEEEIPVQPMGEPSGIVYCMTTRVAGE